MKKALLSSILLISSTSLFANTTMCFKENHTSMSTIENTKLDGGLCNGEKSVNDMKAQGWIVDDIKISQLNSGMNFIYILKQPSSTSTHYSSNETTKEMEARIISNLEKKKEAEENAKKVIKEKELIQDGETIYIAKCQSCHGSNGELEARGFSRPINSLSLEEMQTTIRDYTNGTYNRGLATIMLPIANSITNQDIEKVNLYLKKINTK